MNYSGFRYGVLALDLIHPESAILGHFRRCHAEREKERKRGNQRKLGQRRLNRFCRDVNKPMIVTTWSMTLTLVY